MQSYCPTVNDFLQLSDDNFLLEQGIKLFIWIRIRQTNPDPNESGSATLV